MVVGRAAPKVCRLAGALGAAQEPRRELGIEATPHRNSLLGNLRVLKKHPSPRPVDRVELVVTDVVTPIGVTHKLPVLA